MQHAATKTKTEQKTILFIYLPVFIYKQKHHTFYFRFELEVW